MQNLFSEHEEQEKSKLMPLAERMRPSSLTEVVGQQHLLSEQGAITRMLQNGSPRSMIMWGPPGTGKTTIARLIAHTSNAVFERISAVETGVKDLREIIKRADVTARSGRRHILFIDEIHRFNKSQQDALLHAVENGTLILVGATTENPSFEVNAALISRCAVYRLKPLSQEETEVLLRNALSVDSAFQSVQIAEEDLSTIARLAGGDGRSALNILETAHALSESGDDGVVITNDDIEKAIQHRVVRYDKKGEEHFNVISALIKSLRGSDPDAALIYLALMIEAGEDALFIARRLIVFASEDIGNADTQALTLAVSTFQALERIGMPEGRIVLSQCVCYLASAVKSNASYVAIEKALQAVQNSSGISVPLHMRNAPTSYMKDEGFGKGYQYPHDFPEHFVRVNYFPEGLENEVFYKPDEQEADILNRLRNRWPERYKE